MANLTHNTNWTGSNDQTRKAKTYTFDTGGRYVDKNIALTVNVPGMALADNETFYIESTTSMLPRFNLKYDSTEQCLNFFVP